MDYVVTGVVQHGTRVKEFQIRHKDGRLLPAWTPGSHILVRFVTDDGRAFENHYSLVGVPEPSDSWRIAVQLDAAGQGGSRYLHEAMGPGSAVDVSGPFDSFPLTMPDSHPSPRVVLVAGGIGVTPLVSMAHALADRETPFVFHYLAHTADRLALLDELQSVAGDSLVTHVSTVTGRTRLEEVLGHYSEGDQVYACGPSGLLQALVMAGESLGWPKDAVHVESFGRRVQPTDAPLTVELALSGTTIEVAPGTSILDALIAADAFVSYECKRGECGNCYTPVLEGEPLHRDVCLTPELRTAGMCTCVSWASSGRLVLEL
ncbi:hypothetical protein BJI69_17675 [Luteibacter rhizovicinus DSM 16549]|uniref:Oxidoreductase n=1 Tax=Luteibacter rhizovicinus DSM 16549 TaxID=1440763 RepID=A0A1L3EWX1_9GAMM|nr:PDR/VanB family oxidoreductase [Luteibacter rhizovicinus]APG05549.1 hypothetical protein BJI69_17675 [Luteibacter rhizovicinus DSM 16549]